MNRIKHTLIAGCCVLVLLASACSSHIPVQIRETVEGAPEVAEVRTGIDNFVGRTIRWGGVILDTENRQNASRLTIIAFPLDSDGEPRSSAMSPGRFIAVVDEFLEPKVYKPEREITVTGRITAKETIDVGDYPYEYPVVEVEHYYLWPVRQDPVYNNYPPYWWYDPYYPWHYPYYPYYPGRPFPKQ